MLRLNSTPLVYHIESVTSSPYQDQSGFNNLSTHTTTLGTGKFNNSIKPGINFVSAGTNQINLKTNLLMNNGYSAFVTLNCATVGSGTSNALDVPFVICGDTTATAGGINFGLDGNNPAVAIASTEIVGSGGNAANGSNHTIALSCTSFGAVRLFLDGVLTTTGSNSSYSRTVSVFNCVGQGASSGDCFNNGNIAEVFVWNGAIDDSLVRALHERALTLWI
jgi:Concanavalin A-like lectin/glucanases superfamily